MRKRLLVFLTLAALLPSIAVVLAAGAGLWQYEEAIEDVTCSYVQNLAESVASRIDLAWGRNTRFSFVPTPLWLARLLPTGPFVPGIVAVANAQGALLAGTQHAEILMPFWRKGLPLGEAVTAKTADGSRYTVAAYPVKNGELFVIAAVSWDQLLGPMVKMGTLWPLLLALIGFWGVGMIFAIWKWILSPLRSLEGEVASLKWGEEVPKRVPEPVFELERLREAFIRLAQTAIERSELTRRYVGDLIRAQEEERSRLSREIHDGPLQDVTALVQQVRLANDHLSGPAPRIGMARKHLDLAAEAGKVAAKDLRQLCDALTPPWLDLGLPQALAELADRLSQQWGIPITVEAEEIPEFSPQTNLTLFRVVQEALANALRHGRAQHIQVLLEKKGTEACLEIKDDGVGFTLSGSDVQRRLEGHRGLFNMEERMDLIGGTLEISSNPNRGTQVRCRIPIPPGSA